MYYNNYMEATRVGKYEMIGVSRELKDALDKIKIHPRETYAQVIERLIVAKGV